MRALAIVAAVVVTLLLAFDAVDALELPARDLVLRRMPHRAAEHTVVAAIDEPSLKSVGPWPWDRAVLASLVRRAAAGGAKAVVLDILLAEARPNDAQLSAAAAHVPTLAVAVLDEHGRWLLPAETLTNIAPAHGSFELDHDGILRRLAATKQSRDRALGALSVEAASFVTGAAIPVGVSIAPAFRTRPREVPQVSAASLLRGATTVPLRNRIVFIGPTALALADRVLTPTSSRHLPDPGVTVHAAATESLIRGDTIHELPPIVSGLLAGAIVAFVVRRRRLAAGIALALVVVGGVTALANDVAIPFVTLTATTIVALAGVEARAIAGALRTTEEQFAEQRQRDAESKRVLAHELKTPLASMRNLTQLLAGFELSDAERTRVATLLQAEAGKLQEMVAVLLDLERLPLREFASSSSVIDLGDVVRNRVEFLRAASDRTIFVSTENGVAVRGDAALLDRVVDNLVGNALKYTEPPAPITVRVARAGANATLDVEDRGPGIADADRDRIFQRFVRGTSAAGTEGLGLGLALVADIVRWHGGSASVDSAPGGGARFSVALPLVAGAAKVGAM